MPDPAPSQPNNPLHGITLERMLKDLVQYYDWKYMADRIPIRCFMFAPSITSSLKFLRKTPWARAKVENLYWGYLAETARAAADQSAEDQPSS